MITKDNREMMGVGYPLLSAISECADAAHGNKGHICACCTFVRCTSNHPVPD